MPHDPATAVLALYPRESESCVHSNTLAEMVTAAQNWRQHKGVATCKWITQQRHIHRTEPRMRRIELLIHTGTQTSLDVVMLKPEENTPQRDLSTYNFRKRKAIRRTAGIYSAMCIC